MRTIRHGMLGQSSCSEGYRVRFRTGLNLTQMILGYKSFYLVSIKLAHG